MHSLKWILAVMASCIVLAMVFGCSSNGGDDDTGNPNQIDDDTIDDDQASDDDDSEPSDDDSGGDDDTSPVDDDSGGDDDTTPDDDDSGGDDDSGDDDDSAADDDTFESGIFTVTGSDSLQGDYEGLVEIRKGDSPNFIRLVQYNNLQFPDPRLGFDYSVNTAWTGTLTGGQSPTIEVSLKVADFITHYGELDRTAADGDPVIVNGTITSTKKNSYDVSYQTAEGSVHSFTAAETWTFSQPNGENPLFVNEDKFSPSHGPMPQSLHDLVFFLLQQYHSLPFFDNYRDREDFIAAIHYFAQTRTDFDWYRQHTHEIRVVNKWIDAISMAEAMLRARSFSPKFYEKAAMFDAEMPTQYLNTLGMFSSALYGSDPLQQSESGDGLLWTGCYLASQVFRYLTTGEQAALDNWLRALDGLFLSHDMPQDPTTFGRTVRLHQTGGGKEWIQGTGPYEEYDWLCCGNNDMIQGLYYGYLLSWLFLPDDPQYDSYREGIAQRAAILADSATVALDGEFNEIKANWIAYLATQDEKYKTRYQQLWSNSLLKFYTWFGGGQFYVWGITDWSGQHLDTIGQLVLWFSANASDDQESLQIINEGWSNGMRMNSVTQTFWPIAAYSLSDPPSELDGVLEIAVWNMRETPFPKQSLSIDRRIDPTWCASPFPSLFWKFDWMQGGRYQGLYGVPVFERMHSNILMTSPLDFEMGETDWTDGGGADFLHAYWLGRYYGVFSATD